MSNVVGDRVIPVAAGRLLADMIPVATMLELPGDDHFSWCMPHWARLVDTYLEFVLGHPVQSTVTRRFATVLFTDIVDSTSASAAVGDVRWLELLESHDRIARELIDALAGIGISIRAGAHAGEIEMREDGDISGIAVNLAARVEHAGESGSLWVTSTVRDMMLGGSVVFADVGEHELKGIDGAWRLYRLAR